MEVAKVQDKKTLPSNENNNLLVMLKQAQEQSGYLTEDAICNIAHALDISVSEVYGVSTFYSFLSKKPLGQNVIRVCRSLPCYLKNSSMIIQAVEDTLGIKPGETTDDRKFSLELTNCIGACDKAPAMLINNDVHGNLTPESISQILETYINP